MTQTPPGVRNMRIGYWVRRVAIAIASLLAIGTAPAISQALTKVPITLNWKFYGVHGCLFLAQDKGYFAQQGLEVTLDAGDGSANVVNRLAGGAYEIGFGDVGAIIRFNSLNPDRMVKAIYQDAPSDLAVVTLKGRGIAKPADVEG